MCWCRILAEDTQFTGVLKQSTSVDTCLCRAYQVPDHGDNIEQASDLRYGIYVGVRPGQAKLGKASPTPMHHNDWPTQVMQTQI